MPGRRTTRCTLADPPPVRVYRTATDWPPPAKRRSWSFGEVTAGASVSSVTAARAVVIRLPIFTCARTVYAPLASGAPLARPLQR